ncbi:MAG: type 4a pilus biogenesis protein PilO [Spirochaetota bacterium]
MGELNTRKKVLLTGFLIAAAGFCFSYFLFIPQFKAYARAKEELVDYRLRLAKARETAAFLKEENENYAKTRENLKKAGKLFETEMRDGYDVILLGLKSAAENIEITAIEPGKIKENQYSLELPLKVTAQGDYVDIINFCKDMENLSNLSEVRSINVQSLDYLNPGAVKATFSLIIFSGKTPKERLHLEEIARWAIGRYNIFWPVGAVAPLPELAGHLKLPEKQDVQQPRTEAAPFSPDNTQQPVTSKVYAPSGQSDSAWRK